MSDTNKFALLVSHGRAAPSSLQASAQSSSKGYLFVCSLFPRASPFIPLIDISALLSLPWGPIFWGDCYSDKIGH